MAARLFEDKDHAAEYVKHRPKPDEVVLKIMGQVKERMPRPLNLAVDVGCGSGQGTVLLAPHFSKVVGTDVSPAQLENTRANHHPPNVSYRKSPAEDLPFESGTVDVVTAMTAAHWFDFPRFLVEVDRILKPGGCLALLGYSMSMLELECGDVSKKLNEVSKEVIKEFFSVLRPYSNSRVLPSSWHRHQEMFDSCPYPDKEWHDGLMLRRPTTVNGYIRLLETCSTYKTLKQNDPTLAESLCNRIQNKLLDALGVSSLETEVTLITNYYYWLGWKP